MSGPLSGIRVLEIAGLGAAPFCGMILADLGAEVIRVDRTHGGRVTDPGADRDSFVDRGRRSIALNLKSPEGVAILLRLVETSDALIEAFRPGVAERLGFGPEACLMRNEKLIYGRMTGWGQTGPLSQAAGHDLNYIATSGALHAIGSRDAAPTPPLNLVGDYGGGGMLLAIGILSAILESVRTGKGQVVDAAMNDGAAMLMTEIYSQYARGNWTNARQDNFLDGGAPFYRTYETRDGKFVSIAAIEARFYAILIEKCGIEGVPASNQWDKGSWHETCAKFEARFKEKTQKEWCLLLEGTDACFSPVLDFEEAALHPHNKERRTFRQLEGQIVPAPAPRFSKHGDIALPPLGGVGSETAELLGKLGYTQEAVSDLITRGICSQS
ncbi:CaiB/BaiF CoA transferase family protein [Hoeflea alexandrii]|uniref:CaiB/BaiF CoA transferase family protein n=1 Tax=Hoeflea alexandrii TaxID=288436 RepID=UPI0022AF817E|nr:CaiB/BaiF CoA-transferase family protein [Hoeflea alexandrii]MCZ4291572.1 CaiB/BaiF CoA-transferase family protein [Hoeflea alexandrii]